MSRSLAYEAPAAAAAAAGRCHRLDDVARFPTPGDNAAIATTALAAGAVLERSGGGAPLVLAQPVLEGHRFAAVPIAEGALLTSWGQPFGRALRPIGAGEWVRNSRAVRELRARGVPLSAGVAANFEDYVQPHELDAASFRPGVQPPLAPAGLAFQGFPRPGGRGGGPRHYAVLGCGSCRANAFARALERRMVSEARGGLDGVVALAHTEDGAQHAADAAPTAAHNRPLLVRTLLGLLVHPNVGCARSRKRARTTSLTHAIPHTGGTSSNPLRAARSTRGACSLSRRCALVLQTDEDERCAAEGRGVTHADLVRAADSSGRRAALDATPHVAITVGGAGWHAELMRAQARPATSAPATGRDPTF